MEHSQLGSAALETKTQEEDKTLEEFKVQAGDLVSARAARHSVCSERGTPHPPFLTSGCGWAEEQDGKAPWRQPLSVGWGDKQQTGWELLQGSGSISKGG